MPQFLTKKYRHITCLLTINKLTTSIFLKQNYHLSKSKISSEEQRGCFQGGRGCKEQSIIVSEILSQAKLKHRNLFYA